MNYIELAPVKLTKRENHARPCKTENHAAKAENDESETHHAISPVLPQEKTYCGGYNGVDREKESIDLLPAGHKGFRGSHKELVLLKQYRNFGLGQWCGGFPISVQFLFQ